MKSALLSFNSDALYNVYTADSLTRLQQVTEFLGAITSEELFRSPAAYDAEVLFTTWGIPVLTGEQIASYFPNVKAVFHAAGTVQAFARPYFERDCRLFSGWQANAVPVAEYTFAQILLALKGYFQVQLINKADHKAALDLFKHHPGAYHTKVGLLGCGAIGSRVAELLKATDVEVLAYDPFLSDQTASQLNVHKVDIDTIFANCNVISNHLANLPATVGIIKRAHLMAMKPYASFINTGRGPQLNEQDLYDALTAEPTRTALLDVLTNEADTDNNPLKSLPNCFITPHIAGAVTMERQRLSEYMIDEYERFAKNEETLYEITPAMLETMA